MPLSDAKKKANKKYNQNKTKMVGLRLINKEYELFENYCKNNQISMSGLIRQRIDDIIHPDLENAKNKTDLSDNNNE